MRKLWVFKRVNMLCISFFLLCTLVVYIYIFTSAPSINLRNALFFSNSSPLLKEGPLCGDTSCIMINVFSGRYYRDILPSWTKFSQRQVNLKHSPTIPYIAHSILTESNHKPVDLSENEIETIQSNWNLLQHDGQGLWKLIIWVPVESELLPRARKFCYDLEFCIVRRFHELSGYLDYEKVVNYLINANLKDMAADIVKMIVLHQLGGVYLSRDFHLIHSTQIFHRYFDFYGVLDFSSISEQLISSKFLAVKPRHPVISQNLKLVDHVYGVVRSAKLPFYIYDSIPCQTAAVLAGSASLTVSFHIAANKFNTSDFLFMQPVVAPKDSLVKSTWINYDGVLTEVPAFGYFYEELSASETLENQPFCSLSDPVIRGPSDPLSCTQSQREYAMDSVIEKVLESSPGLKCQSSTTSMDRIPFISHRVWLSDPKKPLNLNKQVYELILKTMNTLDSGSERWDHYWWVMDINQYTEEMKKLFTGKNIYMKSMNDLYDYYPGLREAIQVSSTLSYSLSVDLVKWIVIYHYGGLYVDADYEVQSTITLETLHRCSEIYFSHDKLDWMLNGLIGSRPGNYLAFRSFTEYLKLLTQKFPQFPHCSRVNQIMLMNAFGHVKPISHLVLGEIVNSTSIIMIANELAVDKLSIETHCERRPYGRITLETIGLDYRFHTWKEDNQVESLSHKDVIYSYSKRFNNFYSMRSQLSNEITGDHFKIPRILHFYISETFWKRFDFLKSLKTLKNTSWKINIWLRVGLAKSSIDVDSMGLGEQVEVLFLEDYTGSPDGIKYFLLNKYGGLFLNDQSYDKLSLLKIKNLDRLHAHSEFYSLSSPDSLQMGPDSLLGSAPNGYIVTSMLHKSNEKEVRPGVVDTLLWDYFNRDESRTSLLLPNCIFFDEECKLAGKLGFIGWDLCADFYNSDL